ncbi:MAG: DNA/RNA nuclease SfsA, partial [Deltaproteobacteria bacterium]|nr:DNA/RNA nuclease SfsA [Deltaproteobacteria bacterium]
MSAGEGSGPAVYWPPLTEGTLLKREKRFLVHVRLKTGETVTGYTNNTGRMTGCCEPGRTVYLSERKTARGKYPYRLEMILMDDGLVGVDTLIPNQLAAAAAGANFFPAWPKDPQVVREAVLGRHRLDLKLSAAGETAWVEVKNCSWVEEGTAYFPDAVSLRAAGHMKILAELAAGGDRAQVLILVQRSGARVFRPAGHIDPQFAASLREA